MTRWLGLIWLVSAVSWAGEIQVSDFHLVRGEAHTTFQAHCRFELSEPVQLALLNAIPVTFRWELELSDTRDYWPDRELWSADGRLRLSYRSLSRRYTLSNPDTGYERSFSGLQRALNHLRSLTVELPPLDQVISAGEQVQLGFRLKLDIGQLPPPLRLPAYLAEEWRLDSGWVRAAVDPS